MRATGREMGGDRCGVALLRVPFWGFSFVWGLDLMGWILILGFGEGRRERRMGSVGRGVVPKSGG